MNAVPRRPLSGRRLGDDADDGAVPLAAAAARRLRALFERGQPEQPRGLLVLDLRIRQLPGGLWVVKARRIDDGQALSAPAEALIHIGNDAGPSAGSPGLAENYFCFRPIRRDSKV
jgi:hypothetical protein